MYFPLLHRLNYNFEIFYLEVSYCSNILMSFDVQYIVSKIVSKFIPLVSTF